MNAEARTRQRYWLLKTEPDVFPWASLVAAGARGETWDGIRNHQAANYLREMKKGDLALIYHTGSERQIVGISEVIQPHYPDPTDPSGRFVAVTVRAREPLAQPVTLAAIKAEPGLADFLLVRHSRLSVMPVGATEWRIIQRMAKGRK